jgi:hypothetical protein
MKTIFGTIFTTIGVIASLIACYDYFITPKLGIQFLNFAHNLETGKYTTIPHVGNLLEVGESFMLTSVPSPPNKTIGMDSIFRVNIDNKERKFQAEIEFDIFNSNLKPITIFEPVDETFFGLNIFFSYRKVTESRPFYERILNRLLKKEIVMAVKGHNRRNYLPVNLPNELFPIYLSGKQSRRINITIDLTPVLSNTSIETLLSQKAKYTPVILSLFNLNFQTTEGIKEISRSIGFVLYADDIDQDAFPIAAD